MRIAPLTLDFDPLPGPVPACRARASAEDWLLAAQAMRQGAARLVALWADDEGGEATVWAAYAHGEALCCIAVTVNEGCYPDIAGIFGCAARMQRAVGDLHGFHAVGATDVRPWLDHGTWGSGYRPLRQPMSPDMFPAVQPGEDYAFVRVEGDGVHEIPVGPVHAGIIEPGHFRFSIVGEKVLRLEERLGYKHKGIEQRFATLPPADAVLLAGRVSGDSTVAYAWAYAMALEAMAGVVVTPRAASLRALLLERERVANHLGDLGALGNDAAFAFGLTHFMRLKEDWLRLNREVFGHRFGMDCIVPGGVSIDVASSLQSPLLAQVDATALAVAELADIYEAHAGLQDRFIGTGRVSAALARELGLTGFAARASGLPHDLRRDAPCAPYDTVPVAVQSASGGDVAARVRVRLDEVFESLRLIRTLVEQLPQGVARVPVAVPAEGFGIGRIEGWRGEVLVALRLAGGRIARCHCHDPSWQNWPVLEHAVIGNIVPDFPLINKSFNLSYAGHDL